VPFVGEELVRADPVVVVVGDRGDEQFVGAGDVLQRVESAEELSVRSSGPSCRLVCRPNESSIVTKSSRPHSASVTRPTISRP
jgi:hypothetical protein